MLLISFVELPLPPSTAQYRMDELKFVPVPTNESSIQSLHVCTCTRTHNYPIKQAHPWRAHLSVYNDVRRYRGIHGGIVVRPADTRFRHSERGNNDSDEATTTTKQQRRRSNDDDDDDDDDNDDDDDDDDDDEGNNNNDDGQSLFTVVATVKVTQRQRRRRSG